MTDVVTWSTTDGRLTVYRGGIEAAVIPASAFVHLLHDITRSMVIEQSGAGNGK